MECKFCNKLFEPKPKRDYIKLFCSLKCKTDYLRKINSGKNNPMYGKKSWNQGLNKFNNKKIKKISYKISRTRKKLSKENKLPPLWNKGLNKFNNKKIKQAGIKISITKKKQHLKHWNFKGRLFHNGYIRLYLPKHPFSSKQGYIGEHRIIMEKKLGRYLKPKEVIHHIDGNRLNNNINNLQLFKNSGEHQWIAHKELHKK